MSGNVSSNKTFSTFDLAKIRQARIQEQKAEAEAKKLGNSMFHAQSADSSSSSSSSSSAAQDDTVNANPQQNSSTVPENNDGFGRVAAPGQLEYPTVSEHDDQNLTTHANETIKHPARPTRESNINQVNQQLEQLQRRQVQNDENIAASLQQQENDNTNIRAPDEQTYKVLVDDENENNRISSLTEEDIENSLVVEAHFKELQNGKSSSSSGSGSSSSSGSSVMVDLANFRIQFKKIYAKYCGILGGRLARLGLKENLTPEKAKELADAKPGSAFDKTLKQMRGETPSTHKEEIIPAAPKKSSAIASFFRRIFCCFKFN